MAPAPTWIKVLRVLVLLGIPGIAIRTWEVWEQSQAERDESLAMILILLACLHLLWRAPYKPWRAWEWPAVMLSVSLAATGGFLFTPADEERVLGLQIFIATFAGLVVAYGFFCTALRTEHPMRESVVAPTKAVSKRGIIGFDFGLVAAPFAFVYFLIRHYRVPSTDSER